MSLLKGCEVGRAERMVSSPIKTIFWGNPGRLCQQGGPSWLSTLQAVGTELGVSGTDTWAKNACHRRTKPVQGCGTSVVPNLGLGWEQPEEASWRK